jgi:hypothetical protein
MNRRERMFRIVAYSQGKSDDIRSDKRTNDKRSNVAKRQETARTFEDDQTDDRVMIDRDCHTT